MSLGLLFSGQGAQRIGMGVDFVSAFPRAQQTFAEASDILGYDLQRVCADGPSEKLAQTEITQPAILTTSIAIVRVWMERFGLMPVAAIGHSLGEWTALVAAGALAFADAVRLVALRGRAMQEAVPTGQGKMVAVLGLEASVVEEVCREATNEFEIVTPANYNAPGQIVISGHAAAVECAVALARQRGAKRILPLDVSAPFHCPLMQPAAKRMAEALAETHIGALQFGVIANIDGQAYARDGSDARERLVAQICAPVRWEDCVRTLRAAGVQRTLECGPGKVATALVKRIEPEMALSNIETVTDLAGWVVS